MNPRVINVKPLSSYTLLLEFENKKKKIFSIEKYLNYPIYKELKNSSFFKTVKAKYGTVVWGNEELIDFDPDTLWLESVDI